MTDRKRQIIGRDEHHEVRPAHREAGGVHFGLKGEKSHPDRDRRQKNLDTLEAVLADMMIRNDG